MKRLLLLAEIVCLALVAAHPALAAPAPRRLIVAPEAAYTTIQAALAVAAPGDTIEVRGGVHAGPVVVNVPGLILEGIDTPVIDGGGEGTVVTLAAEGVVLRGFEVRRSGNNPDGDDTGITLTAPGIMVEDNRLSDVLFGVFVAEADGAVLRGNDITGIATLELGRKGDGIRVWYSQDVRVEDNHVHSARDVVAWYSSGLVLRGNVVEAGRYGLHLMYCDETVVAGNTFRDNSVGVFTMYSRQVILRDNLLSGQRGPSGYALGFKDSDDITALGNVLVNNRAGVFLDSTPFSPVGFGRFENNVLAYNDTGVILLPAVRGNTFAGNTLWENVEQVAIQGGGQGGANDWTGNFWSDYGGLDTRGAGGQPDGVGDSPYFSERLFESLIDREPTLRILLYSPAVQALELAAAAFPVVRLQPKLVDRAPLMAAAALPTWALPERRSGNPLGAAALLLAAVAGLIGLAVLRPGEHTMNKSNPRQPTACGSQATVVVSGVSKRYGKVQALQDVNFEAQPGEALALWGANGAGKSTLLKAMLGLVTYRGQIAIAGHASRHHGKLARRSLGYVPQEAVFYDLSLRATLDFYARLRQADPARIPALLGRLGLAPHAEKLVPALSGGLKQRLALAVALLSDPPVLLLDEPTANLDAQAQRDYLALLKHLRDEEGKTILFASHRLEEVEAVANRVLLLEQGRLVDNLTPAELLARLLPTLELSLWVPCNRRQDALSALTGLGWPAHFNGRGPIVVQVQAGRKLSPLEALLRRGIPVHAFDLSRGAAWN